MGINLHTNKLLKCSALLNSSISSLKKFMAFKLSLVLLSKNQKKISFPMWTFPIMS